MSRDRFWRSMSRDTKVDRSALFPFLCCSGRTPSSHRGCSTTTRANIVFYFLPTHSASDTSGQLMLARMAANLTATPEWKELEKHKLQAEKWHMRQLFEDDKKRFDKFR